MGGARGMPTCSQKKAKSYATRPATTSVRVRARARARARVRLGQGWAWL